MPIFLCKSEGATRLTLNIENVQVENRSLTLPADLSGS